MSTTASSEHTTIPNLLTYFRLATVPVLLLAFLQSWHMLALLLFLVAGITDLVDGYIARRLNQRSRLGAILDPIADKTLMAVAFVGLATTPGRIIPWWFVILMLIKDGIIMSGIGFILWKKIPMEFGAVYWSKATTLLLILLGVSGLTDLVTPGVAIVGYPLADFVFGGAFITAALMVVTTLEYLRKGLEILQSRRSA